MNFTAPLWVLPTIYLGKPWGTATSVIHLCPNFRTHMLLYNQRALVCTQMHQQATQTNEHFIDTVKGKDKSWMKHVATLLEQDAISFDKVITWSGYNSRLMSEDSLKPPTVIGISHLFPEKSASASMIKRQCTCLCKVHSFWILVRLSVLGAEQPIYAIAKQLQWTFPDILGEDKLVLMLGALHIEGKIHQMIGKLLRDSGWQQLFLKHRFWHLDAQSALDEYHIKPARYTHQVSLMSLHAMKSRHILCIPLDTQEVMDQKVITSLCQVHEVGKDLPEQYVAQTFNTATVPVSNTI